MLLLAVTIIKIIVTCILIKIVITTHVLFVVLFKLE